MTSIDVAILRLYDEHVAAHPEGIKVAEARDAIRDDVRQLVAARPRDLETETDLLLSEVIHSARSERSKSLKRNLDYLLDAFAEDGSGVYIDPLLDQAYRLGDQVGTDKALRAWTPDDFRNLVVTRYRVAAEATTAAAELDRTAQRFIDRMRVAGVGRLGDVDWSSLSLPVQDPAA